MLISACAADNERFPSLAIRDVERLQGQFTPIDAQVADPIRPIASANDIEAVLRRAQQSHSQFRETQPGVLALVNQARGLGIDNNIRQRALVALADLTALRSQTAGAMGDLDLLAAETATRFSPTDQIGPAQAQVAQWLAIQDAALTSLSRQLN